MATDIFKMPKGDTAPRMRGTFKSTEAVPKSLEGASAVLIIQPTGTTGQGVQLGAVTIDATARTWYYDWQAGDTDRAVGDWDIKIKVTYSDDSVGTFPAEGFAILRITETIVLAP